MWKFVVLSQIFQFSEIFPFDQLRFQINACYRHIHIIYKKLNLKKLIQFQVKINNQPEIYA